MRTLILSALQHDVHAAAVHWGLQRCGADPVWVHALSDPRLQPPISLECGGDGLHWPGAFRPGGIRSAWFRRPQQPRPEALPGVAPSDREFVATECKRMEFNVIALAHSARDVFWVNDPARALRAENKFVQLEVAARCGLPVPRTLASSDPDLIRRFVAAHGRVIYKPFQIHSWQDAAGQIFSTYTRVVTPDMLDDDASLRMCPGIFQVMVDKVCDLRVTIVGDAFHAVRFDSEHDGTFVDWRVSSLGDEIRSSRVELPRDVRERLAALMRELGIVFGCVDLVEDADGTLHFLEVNQAGQFLFLEEQLPELPLLRATCALLAQARGDYDITRVPDDVTYANYLATPEYRAWWDSVKDTLAPDGRIPGVTLE